MPPKVAKLRFLDTRSIDRWISVKDIRVRRKNKDGYTQSPFEPENDKSFKITRKYLAFHCECETDACECDREDSEKFYEACIFALGDSRDSMMNVSRSKTRDVKFPKNFDDTSDEESSSDDETAMQRCKRLQHQKLLKEVRAINKSRTVKKYTHATQELDFGESQSQPTIQGLLEQNEKSLAAAKRRADPESSDEEPLNFSIKRKRIKQVRDEDDDDDWEKEDNDMIVETQPSIDNTKMSEIAFASTSRQDTSRLSKSTSERAPSPASDPLGDSPQLDDQGDRHFDDDNLINGDDPTETSERENDNQRQFRSESRILGSCQVDAENNQQNHSNDSTVHEIGQVGGLAIVPNGTDHDDRRAVNGEIIQAVPNARADPQLAGQNPQVVEQQMNNNNLEAIIENGHRVDPQPEAGNPQPRAEQIDNDNVEEGIENGGEDDRQPVDQNHQLHRQEINRDNLNEIVENDDEADPPPLARNLQPGGQQIDDNNGGGVVENGGGADPPPVARNLQPGGQQIDDNNGGGVVENGGGAGEIDYEAVYPLLYQFKPRLFQEYLRRGVFADPTHNVPFNEEHERYAPLPNGEIYIGLGKTIGPVTFTMAKHDLRILRTKKLRHSLIDIFWTTSELQERCLQLGRVEERRACTPKKLELYLGVMKDCLEEIGGLSRERIALLLSDSIETLSVKIRNKRANVSRSLNL